MPDQPVDSAQTMITTIGYVMKSLGETVDFCKAEHKGTLVTFHYHPEQYPQSVFFDVLDDNAAILASYACSPDGAGLAVFRVQNDYKDGNLITGAH